jgi:hypothetical protein
VLAKLIFNGQVCVWETDRRQAKRKKTLHQHLIKQRIVEVYFRKMTSTGMKKGSSCYRLDLRKLQQKGCGKKVEADSLREDRTNTINRIVMIKNPLK